MYAQKARPAFYGTLPLTLLQMKTDVPEAFRALELVTPYVADLYHGCDVDAAWHQLQTDLTFLTAKLVNVRVQDIVNGMGGLGVPLTQVSPSPALFARPTHGVGVGPTHGVVWGGACHVRGRWVGGPTDTDTSTWWPLGNARIGAVCSVVEALNVCSD